MKNARSLGNTHAEKAEAIMQYLMHHMDGKPKLFLYEDIIERFHIHYMAPGPVLEYIAQWCHQNGRPHIGCLVVKKPTGVPGFDYMWAFGVDPLRERIKVWAWNWSIEACPTARELHECYADRHIKVKEPV